MHLASDLDVSSRRFGGSSQSGSRFLPAGGNHAGAARGASVPAVGKRRSRRPAWPVVHGSMPCATPRPFGSTSATAMARTRAVGAARPKRIVILCSIPLPGLPVDHLVDWQELVTDIPSAIAKKVDKLRQAIRNPDGTLRLSLQLSVGGLVADAPHVFPNESASREWLQDGFGTSWKHQVSASARSLVTGCRRAVADRSSAAKSARAWFEHPSEGRIEAGRQSAIGADPARTASGSPAPGGIGGGGCSRSAPSRGGRGSEGV